MAKSPVGTDVHQSFDVGRNIPSEISFHFILLVNDVSDPNHLGLRQFVHLGIPLDVRLFENFIG